jgi:hypothetical protein
MVWITLFERIMYEKGSWGSFAKLENAINFWIQVWKEINVWEKILGKGICIFQ